MGTGGTAGSDDLGFFGAGSGERKCRFWFLASGGGGGFCFSFFLVPLNLCLVTKGTVVHGGFVFRDGGSDGFIFCLVVVVGSVAAGSGSGGEFGDSRE